MATLIDAAGARGAYLYRRALRLTDEPQSGAVYAAKWAALQRELLAQRFEPYEEVVKEVNARLARALGWEWSSADDDEFLEWVAASQPFPDARPVLERIAESGIRVALLTNSTPRLLEHALLQLGPAVSLAITSEEVGAYKPAAVLFDELLRRLNAQPTEVVHVAAGYDYDIPPARAAGMRTFWVDRGGGATDPRAATFAGRTLWDVLGASRRLAALNARDLDARGRGETARIRRRHRARRPMSSPADNRPCGAAT